MTFTHTFKNGKQLSLEFDMEQEQPFCQESVDKLFDFAAESDDIMEEYKTWIRTVVIPSVFEAASEEQKLAMAVYALKSLHKLKQEAKSSGLDVEGL